MTVVSPFLTFPPIGWWLYAAAAETIVFEGHEHYQKMSDRNRYRISGSNNSILLTVPLEHGRNQHMPIAEVQIKNDGWQVQHWRTIVSVYNRSPFFFHYEPSLYALYEQRFTHLTEFNRVTIEWVKKQLKLGYSEEVTVDYRREYPEGYTDLRGWKSVAVAHNRYYQVFEDRIGFVNNLSILDLLFSEGPHAAAFLKAGVIKG